MRPLALLLLLAAAAGAHDLTLRIEPARPAIVVHAAYAASEPATDSDVTVFGPPNPQSPYQTGVTDRHGVFAFVPPEPGDWRILIDDGYGHRAEQTIPVDWAGDMSQAAGAGRSALDKAILGVSVIFGFTGLLLWLQSRRSSEPA